MSLRGRLTLMATLIVGAFLTAGSVVCFVVMRHELRGQVDDQLIAQATLVRRAAVSLPVLPLSVPLPAPAGDDGNAPFSQIITPDGTPLPLRGADPRLPVSATDRDVAAGRQRQSLADRTADGRHLRVLTVNVGDRGAVQLGRSLRSVDDALERLRLVLALLIVGSVGLSVVAGRVFSRTVLAPMQALTEATEHIEATGDLGRRVPAGATDEVGRLATSFNAMLDRLQLARAALEESSGAQRQLVADASHELRTPIASLRTNIEVLLADGATDADERRALMADVVEQTEELSAVVADLIELARGDLPLDHEEELDLAAIVDAALLRARRHAPGFAYEADVEPWPMSGSPERLGRAVNNLLDNAAKFSPPGSPIVVTLRDGELRVRDHGPGVPPTDLPHLFDRFYRGADAAGVLGSGLGLAIVRQVTEAHGGAALAEPGPGGGLQVTLRFN